MRKAAVPQALSGTAMIQGAAQELEGTGVRALAAELGATAAHARSAAAQAHPVVTRRLNVQVQAEAGAQVIACVTHLRHPAPEAAAGAALIAGTIFAAGLKQHQPAQVTAELLRGKHAETLFVVLEKPPHRAQVIAEVLGAGQHTHAMPQVYGIAMIQEAAQEQEGAGAERIVQQAPELPQSL